MNPMHFKNQDNLERVYLQTDDFLRTLMEHYATHLDSDHPLTKRRRNYTIFGKRKIMKIINLRNDVRDALLRYFDSYLTNEDQFNDIGCGGKPFASALDGKVKKYIGADVEDGFYDSSYILWVLHMTYLLMMEVDAIISSRIFEHLERKSNRRNGAF